MLSPFCKYLEALRQFPFSVLHQPQYYFRRPGRDFTRRRSLPLERLVWLGVGLLKKTLFVELDQFFSSLGTGELPVSKSALCQARQKLLPRFYQDFFACSVQAFYRCFPHRRWRGFRLWATDGTGFRLPDAPGVGEVFGWHGNQHNRVPSTRLLMCFDLLNQVIASVNFHTRHTSEVVMAQRQIAAVPPDVLMIYDRGYASHIIPFLHLLHGSHCLIRMPVERSATVKAFVESGKNQAIITERLQYKARLALRELTGQDLPFDTTITYRLIRIVLKTGEVEVLLTTLLDKKRYPYPQFGVLYGRRWGVETCFFVLKSYFQLSSFAAHKPDACWHDIFDTLLLYNLQTASFWPLKPHIHAINRRRRHDYQPNRNVTGGLLKRFVVRFFLRPREELQAAISEYQRLFLMTLEPIRPNRKKERRRRVLRGTERHVHEKNYRRAQ
ncbi:MAG TPA: IS4 family transposase [Saprospiraceae bacterium]|nr:IS4 family transposase [Saprospiraceae bacterium]